MLTARRCTKSISLGGFHETNMKPPPLVGKKLAFLEVFSSFQFHTLEKASEFLLHSYSTANQTEVTSKSRSSH